MNNILVELSKRILVLDGAMGTMLQSKKIDFTHDGNHDYLNITHPEIIKEIHTEFLISGADIIETNTFNANTISQSHYNKENFVYEINFSGAKLARELTDEFTKKNPSKPRFVAGSIGPTNKTASISPDVEKPAYRDVTFDFLVSAYSKQIKGLIDGGVDILLIETIFDTLNAKAAIVAANNIFDSSNTTLPIMISGTLTDKSGRTLSGQTLKAFCHTLSCENVVCIGLNCSFGANDLKPFIQELNTITNLYISVYPNAGLPNSLGEYDETPNQTANYIDDILSNTRVNIIGGCCGTTPLHISKISDIANKYIPKPHLSSLPKSVYCGLETLEVTNNVNFINIGERLNVSGSAKFAKLIREKKYEEALIIACDQVENGAQILDINFDDSLIDANEEMDYFLKLISSEPSISKIPIMIDSSKWEVLETGLKAIQGKVIINSISLKGGEKIFLEQAKIIKRHNAAVVVMAFDEKGQADTYQRKIEICKRSYELLVNKINFKPEDIIFDPNVLAICTGMEEHNNYAVDFINCTKWIKENLPYAKISGGISNLSFSFRGNNTIREAIHSVFLYHAIKAGLDMGIVNPGLIQIYDNIPKELLQKVEAVVLNSSSNASEELIELASNYSNQTQKNSSTSKNEWRKLNINERLSNSIVLGNTEFVEEDINEALSKYESALKIIEEPLMDGMKIVGNLFGDGKMFLPQVVKSARVMKKAVSFLLPYIKKETSEASTTSSGKIVLATVKGDVHDIGKNIVSVVFSCNNFEIIDLGVMVSTEDIFDAIKLHSPDILGLSGLITPSLEEMCNIASEMTKRNLTIPLIIGGATTSKIHTALKIAPLYSNGVIHAKDAAKGVEIVKNLMNKDVKANYLEEMKKDYEKTRIQYTAIKRNLINYSDSNNKKYVLKNNDVIKPNFLGIKTFISHNLEEIRNFIDWTFFFIAWEMNKTYPEILEDEKYKVEAKKLFDDANQILDLIISDNLLTANGTFGIFEAKSNGNDIVLLGKNTTFNMLRQQEKNSTDTYLCLSDFISEDKTDYIGAFAVTCGINAQELSDKYKTNGDEYTSIMIKILADRLAEAYAEYLHYKVRTEYWGYSPNELIDLKQLFKGNYQGIRPAFGYPSLKDHSEKIKLYDLLNLDKIGINFTENFMMVPSASVCGLYFANRESQYFDVTKISSEQLEDYTIRKNSDIKFISKMLRNIID